MRASLLLVTALTACGGYDVAFGDASNDAIDCNVPGACDRVTITPPGSLRVGAMSAEDYESCDCSPGQLHFSNAQAGRFADAMVEEKWQFAFHRRDGEAEVDGLVEDELGGNDDAVADSVDALFISGHGGSFPTYFSFLCPAPAPRDRCFVSSSEMVLGETAGQGMTDRPGRLRWLVLGTCDGVNRDMAPLTWGPVFARGRQLMAVLGYTGTSTDAWTTNEAGADFAHKAHDGWSVMQAWFWASEDWIAEDAASLIVTGTDVTDARRRLGTMMIDWSPDGAPPLALAWAWMEL
jgi:hypothetical protein